MTVNKGINNRRSILKALIFDLDDTLYREEQVPAIVRQHITKYMVEHLGVEASTVLDLCGQLHQQYGTTMAGLVAMGHNIDFDAWHKEVHHAAIDYQHLLKPDMDLRELLCAIDLPKFVFTNADKVHAEKCLQRLGIEDCFQGVFHFEWMMEHGAQHGLLSPEYPVLCKPLPKAYELVLEAVGYQPSEVMFFDDSTRNVAAAHGLGMRTVLVGRDTPEPGADLSVVDLHQLRHKMPELLDQPGLVHDSHGILPEGPNLTTSVLA